MPELILNSAQVKEQETEWTERKSCRVLNLTKEAVSEGDTTYIMASLAVAVKREDQDSGIVKVKELRYR